MGRLERRTKKSKFKSFNLIEILNDPEFGFHLILAESGIVNITRRLLMAFISFRIENVFANL